MDDSSQPLISVVTPVYNGEQFLAECIESVLAQTYQNWEYIIVNNCSTDQSPEVARFYTHRDARIRLHNNTQFLDALQNLNLTFRLISPESKYCKAVHADDWLFPECLARMVEVAEAHPSIGIVSAYRLEEDRVDLDGLPYPSTVIPGREICRLSLLNELYVFGSPSSLLIRSDIVRGRNGFYDESILHADTEACFDILQNHDFGFVHQVLTFTRRHNESRTALTYRFNTRRMANLMFFEKYGPRYLTQKEYENRQKEVFDSYYSFLARSVLELRGADFWHYQQSELQKLGHPLSTIKLLHFLFRELLDFRESVRRVKRGIRAKRIPAAQQDLKRLASVLPVTSRRGS
jgi:glycosyltransferase involved in cell wall biosynthesis